MEQTLLPDGVASAGTIEEKDSNNQSNYLTSGAFRVMYVSVSIIKEADNANRKQKSNQGNKVNRSVPQTELFLRGHGECGRQTSLPAGGWAGIQESFGCRDGHYRACLRRLGLLECANGRDCNCKCPEPGTSNHRNFTCNKNRTAQDHTGTCNPDYSECRQEFQENWSISGPQPKRCTGRSDSLVLPRMWQELHSIGSRNTRNLSGKASGQLKLPEKRIDINKQALIDEGLFCLVLAKTTIPPRPAKVVFGGLPKRGSVLIGSLIGSHLNYLTTSNGGDTW